MSDDDQPITTAFNHWRGGRLIEAAETYRAMLAAGYTDPLVHMNLASVLLALGEFDEGFKEYEWRPKAPPPPFPLWRGEDLANKTIFLIGEQGIGDNFQFIRYAKTFAGQGARVVVGTLAPIADLIRTAPGVAQVVVPGEAVPYADFHLPLMSAPGMFGMARMPTEVPYLFPRQATVDRWRALMSGYPGLKVGLVWAGNRDFPHDHLRSPRLDPFMPLLDVPGVTFFGLQLGAGREDLLGRRMPANFVDLGPAIRPIEEAASAMRSLDLIISSCTGPAHLAGALGCPLWVVLHTVPDWRWMMERTDSPWYPTATLFRQRSDGDWTQVMADVRANLVGRVSRG